MSSPYQLWRFENVLENGQTADGSDQLYVPKVGYITGDLDIHDVAVEDSGRVIDVQSNEIVATGLSMPHSPRVYRDKLWVLNSGTGNFGFIDRATGRF